MHDNIPEEIYDIIVLKLLTVDKIRFHLTCKKFYTRYHSQRFKVEILQDTLRYGNAAGLLIMRNCPTWNTRANIRSIIIKVITAFKNNQRFTFRTYYMNRFDRFICYNIFKRLGIKVEKHDIQLLRICGSSWCHECRALHYDEEYKAYLVLSH